MSALLVAALLGLASGVTSSWFAWWVVNHRFRPRIEFSEEIARETSANGTPTYRVKLRNVGRRSLVDVTFECYWAVRGLDPRYADNWTIVPMPMGLRGDAVLSAARMDRAIHRGDNNEARMVAPPHFARHRTLLLRPELITRSDLPERLSHPELETIGSPSLDDLLAIGGELMVVLKGYDGYSGGRIVVTNPEGRYTRNAIREGPFELYTLRVSRDRTPA